MKEIVLIKKQKKNMVNKNQKIFFLKLIIKKKENSINLKNIHRKNIKSIEITNSSRISKELKKKTIKNNLFNLIKIYCFKKK